MGEPAPINRTELSEYLAVIRQRDAEGKPFVMVGGQAINFWAGLYLQRKPRLQEFLPFTSKDLGLIGNTQQARRIAENIQWEFQPPPPDGAVVQGAIRKDHLLVEFLKPEHHELLPPILMEWVAAGETIPIRVLTPEVLFAKKIALAVDVPQNGFGEIKPRQDVRHTQMMALCLPHSVHDLLDRRGSNQSLRDAVQSIVAVLASIKRGRVGQQFEATHPRLIGWGSLLPAVVDGLELSDVHQRCLAELRPGGRQAAP